METDYKQKYEEALHLAKSYYGKGQNEFLDTLFPELAESEDEKHWKWILEYLYDGLRKADEQFKDQFKSAIAWLEKQKESVDYANKEYWRGYREGKQVILDKYAELEKQKAKERLDRMAPIYNDKESFESALEKAWKYYNESASRTVDSFEDDYIECVFSKGFREGFLYREKQKESLHISEACKKNAYSFTKEDEKIMKRLIDYFKAVGKSWTHRDITGEQILCWLEKQKNLDKMIVVSPEVWDNAISEAYENGKKDGEKQQEQKPARYLKKNMVYAIMTKLTSLSYSTRIPINSYEYKKIDEITGDVRRLLDYPIEQKPAEWSEEDEKRIKQLIYDTEFIKAHYEKRKEELGEQFNNALIRDCDEQIAWLKSLRPSWKPTEDEESKK